MLDCAQFLDEYSEFRDGLLSREALQSFRAHLAACPSCARYDQVIEQGMRVFRELPHVEPSQDFVPRLQHRLYHLDEEARELASHRASGAPLAFTLVIAVVIGASAWVPTLWEDRPAVMELPPVMAHAPHRVSPGTPFFMPAPLTGALAAPPASGAPPASNLLFYRYSPLGSSFVQPAGLTVPQ